MTSALVEDIWDRVRDAYRVLRGVVHKTPLDHSATFSRMTGGSVYLKMENLQKTGAFKVRGAYYKVYRLPEEAKRRGVIAASAGNHAQGVAFAASRQGVPCVIVMPETAPASKVVATKGYGAEVVLHGEVYDEAYEYALRLAEEKGLTFIHAFNDPDVIAGQGTIGLEIMLDLEDVDVIVVPIGGGGLVSGIAVAVKMLNPAVRIIGVEVDAAPSMLESLRAGRIVEVPVNPSIADGIVVKRPGELTFKLVSELVDDVVTVSDDEVSRAIFLLLERCKTVAEGAGAVGLAAVLSGKVDVEGKKVVVVISGGNIDMSLLSRIVMRELVREGRLVVLEGLLPDRPGMLKRVLEVVASEKGNVVEVYHDRYDPRLPPSMARVSILLDLPEPQAVTRIVRRLEELGYAFKLAQER